jgi:endogenous inhibitor of DNA gyrase (YacG/DUF329 family)
MNLDSKHIPLDKAFLCPCGLVGDNAVQCACGNALGLLGLAARLNRGTEATDGLTRYCTKCGVRIADQDRIRHKSPYCSERCRRDARRELRALFTPTQCPTCGRAKNPKPQPSEDSPCIFHTAGDNLPFEATNPKG